MKSTAVESDGDHIFIILIMCPNNLRFDVFEDDGGA